MTPIGLRMDDGLGFDDWIRLGQQLGRISRASAWWLGDWLIYGERAYGGRYRTALTSTELEYQTLRNYAWVARRVPMSRRRDGLSFQHHAEVAALPEAEQDLWLRRAERLRWTRNELRRQLAAARRDATRRPPGPIVVQMRVAPDREERWRRAADAAECDLLEWLADAADQAASTLLDLAHPGADFVPPEPSSLPVRRPSL